MNNLLKTKKMSVTPFRKEVLAIFAKYSNLAIPLSVIETELCHYNRITLYRTLKIFLEKGVIHEISLSGEVSNYAICEQSCTTTGHQHQHIHFKCKACGVVLCVELDKFPTIVVPNYKILELEIQALGLCNKCSS